MHGAVCAKIKSSGMQSRSRPLGSHLAHLPADFHLISLLPMKASIHCRIVLQLIISLAVIIICSKVAVGTSTRSSNRPMKTATSSGTDDKPIRLCFSDVDGTLVHYPADAPHRDSDDDGSSSSNSNPLIFLPPSSTGMRGIISSRTLRLAQHLRSEGCVRLILVSGMRGTTLLKRLPFLPRADAYACDAGGRIFYPVDCSDRGDYDGPIIQPVEYQGASSKDLEPFGIVEDEEWRGRMQNIDAAGEDGYVDEISAEKRRGLLWDFARTLQSQGFVLDFKGYSTCFRVNRKQQKEYVVDDAKFASLMELIPPDGLATSVNLGCVDFYPSISGKRNACRYLAGKFVASDEGLNDLLSKRAVCICDDDNDLEMALACRHAFIPGITSESMRQTIDGNPGHFTVTEDAAKGIVETAATEEALTGALAMISSEAAASQS